MNTLVVARYQEDTSWYERIPSNWTLLEVQKGRELPNTGRESSSYLWAILRHYDDLADDDRMAFVQGNPFVHCPDIDIFLLLNRDVEDYLALGDNTYVCDQSGRPHHDGLPLAEKHLEWFGKPLPGFAHFSPGAQFVVTGKAIKARPKEFYQRLFDDMDGDGPWIIERFWETIFRLERDPVLATFYCQATPATTYLRCELPARYLPGKVSRDVILAQDDEDYRFPHHEGAAVFQFAGDSTYALMAHALASDSPKGGHEGQRVLIEADDNYFVSGPNLKASGWVKNVGQGVHALEGHASIVKWADGCIVTTEELAKAYRKRNANVYVCPNSIDPLDWPYPEKPDDGIFRIGWFASNSHKGDGEPVRRALEWASKQPGVQVLTMGYNPGWNFKRGHIEWQDLPGYRRGMALLDVGLCPIVANPWANCRSDIKALDYTMGAALPVVSDLPPYSLLTHEENALKVGKKPADWLRTIQWCVQNQDEARALGKAAREYTLSERTIQANVEKWREAIEG